MKRLLCTRKHRMIEVTSNLYLCECSSYGAAASLKGAVAEARDLVERAGGIEVLRNQVEEAEQEAKEERKSAALLRQERQRRQIRDGV